ncbi:MAG TPA: hypothetical protein VF411_04300 [Bacteroidia bacterium]
MKEKRKLFALTVILLFGLSGISQVNSQQKTDTIRYYNLLMHEGIQNGKKVYVVNEINIDSVRYAFLYKQWAKNVIRKCRPCYLLELDVNDSIIKEGNFYFTTPIGIYKEYYPNGKLKTIGNYKNVYPLTHDDFKLGVPCIGKCTVKDGEWKYYSDKGKLIKTEKYEVGKLVKK